VLVERDVEHPRIELLRGRWKNQAACLDSDPEVFFPQRGAGKKQINEAKAIGATCPVLSVCRDYVDVIEANIPRSYLFGIFAAELPAERWKGRQRRSLTQWRPSPSWR
jgi:hypothetical protein